MALRILGTILTALLLGLGSCADKVSGLDVGSGPDSIKGPDRLDSPTELGPNGGSTDPVAQVIDPTTTQTTDPGRGNGTGGNGPEPVPEPGTMLLFGTGLTGLAFYRRRRRNLPTA